MFRFFFVVTYKSSIVIIAEIKKNWQRIRIKIKHPLPKVKIKKNYWILILSHIHNFENEFRMKRSDFYGHNEWTIYMTFFKVLHRTHICMEHGVCTKWHTIESYTWIHLAKAMKRNIKKMQSCFGLRRHTAKIFAWFMTQSSICVLHIVWCVSANR